jgi:hypothetical protein
LFEYLEVRHFKYLASAGDYVNRRMRRTDPSFRNVRTYGEAVTWEAGTRFNEAAQLACLVFSVVMVLWLCSLGRYTWLPLIVVLNVLLNVYPILLQRYTRARIRRLQARRHGRASMASSDQCRSASAPAQSDASLMISPEPGRQRLGLRQSSSRRPGES